MISLFTPEFKVQKQRQVMRETDVRLAKYSSRGLLFTLMIFGICMLVGQYQQLRPQMTLILAFGLVFFTLLRGYFVFRFDTLYARAPAKWRNTFFVTSLLSVSWWSFIVANVTLVVGIEAETPLLWLYTTVFLSSVANAYAPYRRFLTLYLFIGLAPIAAAVMITGQPLGLLYGLMLLVLFLMLHNQALDVSRNYWERLQANFNLKKRAYALEVEKIDNESSIANNSAFLKSFSHELRNSLSDVMGALQLLKYANLSDEEKQLVTLAEQTSNHQVYTVNNVLELSNITDKSLVLDINIINLSHHIEQVVETLAFASHQKGMEAYCIFSPNFPVCVRTDAARIDHMLSNLINSAHKFCSITELVIQSSCTLLENAEAELRIEVISDISSDILREHQHIFEAFNLSQSIDATMHLDLNLAITKNIAEYMGGDLGIDYQTNGNVIAFWFTARIEIITNKNPDTVNIPKFNSKRVLLYRAPAKMLAAFIDMLHNWGLEVDVANNSIEGIAKIDEAIQSTQPFHLAIAYTEFDNVDALEFSTMLANKSEYKQLPQILVFSRQQKNLLEIERYLSHHAQVKPLFKPIKQQLLQQLTKQLLIEDKSIKTVQHDEDEWLHGALILLLQTQDIDRLVTEGMLKKLGCVVTSVMSVEAALAMIKETRFDGFIIESHMRNVDTKDVVDLIKEQHGEHDRVAYAPILGLTNQVIAGEETYCLAAGMDGHIEKPLQLDDLRAILSRWLGRREF